MQLDVVIVVTKDMLAEWDLSFAIDEDIRRAVASAKDAAYIKDLCRKRMRVLRQDGF